ncbi:MAG: fibronectin type III domain-containing protein [Chloroflexi bacterium]|nr:fibronectin type III domain-containing protein [Chloroflexota bacterium]
MTSTTTTPQRGVLASFAFLLISMLSAQALAHYNCASLGLQCFNEGPLSYSITSGTTVEVRCSGQVGRGCGGSGKKDIVIPATVKHKGTTYSVTAIGRYGLSISGLTSVIIPDSVTTIGEEAFQGNFLTSVIIPDSVTSIGEEAFFRNALNSVLIPDGVTTIGRKTFSENALTSVIIPDSVTTIGNGAFGDNALTSVTIPDSVTTIEKRAFQYNALTSVIIPDSVTTIGNNAFTSNALTSVTIGNRVTTIGSFAFYSTALTNVTIPDSVTTIGEFAFYNNALTSVTIGNSVTSIGLAAFDGNALTSVTIPASVTTIRQTAFGENALTSAHFGGNFGDFQLNTTSSGSTEIEAMFDVNPNLTTITYCEGTTGWPQDFSNGSTTITATSIVCSPPDAPTIDSITPGAGQLTVAFTPGIDNGSPAYSYTASCLRVVGSGRVRVNVVGPTSPITVPSMYNGDTYECFVTATNIIGTSPASATSEPFVVGAPATFVPPPSGTPPPSTGTPPSSATPVPTSPLWLLGIMAGLLSLVGFRNLRKA